MPDLISIVTAVHNGEAMNRLFLEGLQRYTRGPYELIVIDNASTDGSRALFAAAGARIVANTANFSYPRSQNQGVAEARGDVLAFLNNDIVVAPAWDARLRVILSAQGLDILSPCGLERLESRRVATRLRRRWRAVKTIAGWFGRDTRSLRRMVRLMYGDWERFARRRAAAFGDTTVEGFVGSSMLVTRRALERLGPWDECMQAADFDLYLRAQERAARQGDVRPPRVALGVFHHHFIRFTMAARPVPFADADRLIPFEAKWPAEVRDRWLKREVLEGP